MGRTLLRPRQKQRSSGRGVVSGPIGWQAPHLSNPGKRRNHQPTKGWYDQPHATSCAQCSASCMHDILSNRDDRVGEKVHVSPIELQLALAALSWVLHRSLLGHVSSKLYSQCPRCYPQEGHPSDQSLPHHLPAHYA